MAILPFNVIQGHAPMSVPIESPYATSFRSYRRLLFKCWTLCVFEPSLAVQGKRLIEKLPIRVN